MTAAEMIEAYRNLDTRIDHAINTGGDFDGTLETAEFMDEHYIFCEEENGWYSIFLGWDVTVYEGQVEVSLQRCWDGDWDVIYSILPDSDEEPWDLYEEAERSAKERHEWENKEKPCPHCVECGETPNMIKANTEEICKECWEGIQEEQEWNGGGF